MGLASCCKLELPRPLLFPSYGHHGVVKHQPPSTSCFLMISSARFLLPPTPTTTPLCDSRSRKSVFPLLLRQPLPFAASVGTDKNETTGQEEEEGEESSTSSVTASLGTDKKETTGQEEEEGEESSTSSVTAVNTTNVIDGESLGGTASAVKETIRPEGFVIFIACGIGLLTGIAVVLFNYTVDEIRNLFWDGIPSRGASWLRHEPIQDTWPRTVLVPAFGGLIVGILNELRGRLQIPSTMNLSSNMKGFLRSFMKTIAAAVTLGTGNSLGPEGPSVEIGTSIARGIGVLFKRSRRRNLSLVASGSAAGISSGFNAAVSGCFFAVESVLWPSPEDSVSSVTNATSMVILSAVIASVISEVGLGSAPAFAVPDYDFRSPSELPLYLFLGLICGVVSATLTKCTSYACSAVGTLRKNTSIPAAAFPIMGGLSVGIVALIYPEVLYWGFENVDILLESRPFVNGLPADLLLQLVVAKIATTSLSRASGLVGGYYAPSLFIGAATGTAYGKIVSYIISHSHPIFHLSALEVASSQAYGLVGMAATLSGVCQVPLTSVLLLFELTQDYRILLPLLGAVGLSSWVSSSLTERKDVQVNARPNKSYEKPASDLQSVIYTNDASSNSAVSSASKIVFSKDLFELESSLCVDNLHTEVGEVEKVVLVAQAMKTRYVHVFLDTPLNEAVSLMLMGKESCALIVDSTNMLIGIVTLGDIQLFCSTSRMEKPLISDVWQSCGGHYPTVWTADPDMNLSSAQRIMNRRGVKQLPVVSKHPTDDQGCLIGLIDRECIDLVSRVIATKELLTLRPTHESES
ncbi:chloride channel protein CLC-e isoform X1 [Nymphaea colorata]|nr:chloride channel protein CLC-e isoform X1 [Nymphaea colorata]